MTDQNKMLIEELEKRLLWYREEASADEFDADEVDAICTMLLKLSPESRPRRTKEEAYRNIIQQVDTEEEDERDTGGKRRRFFGGKRRLRAAVIILAAVGALASLNMVSYARENKSLFTMILQRVGVLKIVKDEEAENTLIDVEKITKDFFNSWAELDSEIKQKIAVPGYIPKGYSLYGIEYWNFDNREVLKAEYYDQGNGHLFIEINLWKDNEYHYRETLVDEEKCKLLPEYSQENIYYYEYEDEYICIVFTGNVSYRMEGNIALEEMKKIVESL